VLCVKSNLRRNNDEKQNFFDLNLKEGKEIKALIYQSDEIFFSTYAYKIYFCYFHFFKIDFLSLSLFLHLVKQLRTHQKCEKLQVFLKLFCIFFLLS
jgi:hypothetical protein